MTQKTDKIPEHWKPCLCGGKYSLSHDDTEVAVWHTQPFCERYKAVSDSNRAITFAEENRTKGWQN